MTRTVRVRQITGDYAKQHRMALEDILQNGYEEKLLRDEDQGYYFVDFQYPYNPQISMGKDGRVFLWVTTASLDFEIVGND